MEPLCSVLFCSVKNKTQGSSIFQSLFILIFIGPFIYLFWSEGSSSLGLPQTQGVAEADLELLIFLYPLPSAGIAVLLVLACPVDVAMGTEGSVHARQELSCTPDSSYSNFPRVCSLSWNLRHLELHILYFPA